jgi:hypothetical protein
MLERCLKMLQNSIACFQELHGATARNSLENRFPEYLALSCCIGCQQIFVTSESFFNFGMSQKSQGAIFVMDFLARNSQTL